MIETQYIDLTCTHTHTHTHTLNTHTPLILHHLSSAADHTTTGELYVSYSVLGFQSFAVRQRDELCTNIPEHIITLGKAE